MGHSPVKTFSSAPINWSPIKQRTSSLGQFKEEPGITAIPEAEIYQPVTGSHSRSVWLATRMMGCSFSATESVLRNQHSGHLIKAQARPNNTLIGF